MITLNVRGGLREYQRVMRLKKRREIRIGLALFRSRPVTPMMHPQGGQTYYRLRLEDPTRPNVYVEFLVCDQNLYLIAYRWYNGNVWTDWLYFQDQRASIPGYLLATSTSLPFPGRHDAQTTMPVGPTAALMDIFYVLTNPQADDAAVRRALLRAVILFCEASRILMIFMDMMSRMSCTAVMDDVPEVLMWVRMRRWKKMSRYSLYARNRVLVEGGDGVQEVEQGLQDEPDEKEIKLRDSIANCELYNLDQVIGPEGQLQLILLDEDLYTQFGDLPPFPAGYVDDFREALV